jgi:hypothetical protein
VSLDLAPGDMCVVIDGVMIEPEHRDLIVGKTVILLEVLPASGFWAPFWRCSGIRYGIGVSHAILRKIPPAPIVESTTNEEEVNV